MKHTHSLSCALSFAGVCCSSTVCLGLFLGLPRSGWGRGSCAVAAPFGVFGGVRGLGWGPGARGLNRCRVSGLGAGGEKLPACLLAVHDDRMMCSAATSS